MSYLSQACKGNHTPTFRCQKEARYIYIYIYKQEKDKNKNEKLKISMGLEWNTGLLEK